MLSPSALLRTGFAKHLRLSLPERLFRNLQRFLSRACGIRMTLPSSRSGEPIHVNVSASVCESEHAD